MTSSRPTSKKPTHSSGRPATESLNALPKVLPDGEPIFTKVRRGTKKGVDTEDDATFLDPEHRLTLNEASAWVQGGDNVGVALGCETRDGWKAAALDVEESGVLSTPVKEWADTYGFASFESGHDGLNRLLKVTPDAYELLEAAPTKVSLDGDEECGHDLELLTNSHALFPPSTIKHQHCRDSKDCDETGTGSYHLLGVNPDAPVVDVDAVEDLLDLLDLDPAEGSDGSTVTASYDPENFPEPTEADVAEGRAALEEFYKSTEKKPSDDLHAVLTGETGSLDLPRHDDGSIDRDSADAEAIFLLLGVMEDDGKDLDRSEELAAAVYSHFCEEIPVMKDGSGRPRKWDRDAGYRANRLDAARTFYEDNREQFFKWKRRTESTTEGSGGPRATHGDYSAITIDSVEISLFALANAENKDDVETNVRAFALKRDFVVPESASFPRPASHKVPTPPEPADGGGMDADSERRYPIRREVVSLAQQLDPSREEDTHETVLRKVLRDDLGVAAMAKCPSRPSGNRWVYYPSNMTDPVDAEYVKESGREREPVEPRTVSPTAGQTAVTDGGVPGEVDTDSTDGSEAEWQDWVEDGPEDDGNDNPASTPTGNTPSASIVDETDGPREDNDPANTPSEGRSRGRDTPTGTSVGRTTTDDRVEPAPTGEGTATAPETPTTEAVEPSTKTQTPREHAESASSSSDLCTPSSTNTSEDTGDATSDNPLNDRDRAG